MLRKDMCKPYALILDVEDSRKLRISQSQQPSGWSVEGMPPNTCRIPPKDRREACLMVLFIHQHIMFIKHYPY